jgi:hypothetical protein
MNLKFPTRPILKTAISVLEIEFIEEFRVMLMNRANKVIGITGEKSTFPFGTSSGVDLGFRRGFVLIVPGALIGGIIGTLRIRIPIKGRYDKYSKFKQKFGPR